MYTGCFVKVYIFAKIMKQIQNVDIFFEMIEEVCTFYTETRYLLSHFLRVFLETQWKVSFVGSFME